MRRFDKQKISLLLIYYQSKDTDRDSAEDWKTNVAAGLQLLVVGCELTQTNKPMAPQQGKEIQYSPSENPLQIYYHMVQRMIQLFTQEQYQSLVYNQV
jgi:hypothetical protein